MLGWTRVNRTLLWSATVRGVRRNENRTNGRARVSDVFGRVDSEGDRSIRRPPGRRVECKRCSMTFQVRDGVCVFGMRKDDRALKTQEMDGENKWVCSANDLATHLEFARTSRIQSGATLQRLLVGIGDRPRHEIRVLDVGAGWAGSNRGSLHPRASMLWLLKSVLNSCFQPIWSLPTNTSSA